MEIKYVEDHMIFLTGVGSRAYGTNSPDSDWGQAGVMIPGKGYFYGFDRFDQFRYPGVDKTIYDIRKIVRLLADNNPNCLDLLFSPDRCIIKMTHYWQVFIENRDLFVSTKCRHTFSGYSRAQLTRLSHHRKFLLKGVIEEPTRAKYGLWPISKFPTAQLKAIVYSAMGDFFIEEQKETFLYELDEVYSNYIMVAKMYDISALLRPRYHKNLRVIRWFYQDVKGPDIVGISSVVTSDTPKHLSHSVFPGHQPTPGTCPRGVFRVDQLKTNTVLLSQLSQPCTHLAVRPRGHRFTKIFTAFALTPLEILQSLHFEDPKKRPGEQFTDSVNVTPTGSSGSSLSFGARFLPFDSITNFFEIRAKELPLRSGKHLEFTNVHSDGLTGFGVFLLWDINPQKGSVSLGVYYSPLFEGSPGFTEPMIEPLVPLKGDDDRVTRFEAGNFEDVIKGLFTSLDFTYQGAEGDGVPAFWDGGLHTHQSGILFGDGDRFESHFEGVRSVSVGEISPYEPVHGFGIELTGIQPEGPTIEIDSRSDFPNESVEGSLFGFGGEVNRYWDRSDHYHIIP